MTSTVFLEKLAAILELDGEPLSADRTVEPLFWESLEVIGTIELIDRAGASVKVADILGCQTVGDVLALAKLAPPHESADEAPAMDTPHGDVRE